MQSGDIELNPGPYIAYEQLKEILASNKDRIKYICLNARDLSINRYHLMTLVRDFGENTIFAITETWLTEWDSKELWAIDSEIFEPFKCDRELESFKKKKEGVLHY